MMNQGWTLPPKLLKSLLAIFVLLVAYPFVRAPKSVSYHFEVANDQLFAIETGGFYGAESAVYATDDDGDTWRRVEAPSKTLSLGGNGVALLALTSTHQVWRQSADASKWDFVTSLPGTHHYSILVGRSGNFLVSGIDELTWHAKNGELLRRFTAAASERRLFGKAMFLNDEETHVVIEANPFAVYRLDLHDESLVEWADELPAPPTDVGGPGRIRRHGPGFLFSGYDGIYAWAGAKEPWRLLFKFPRAGAIDDEFCRDLVSLDNAEQGWLLATNQGIRLLRNDQVIRNVFSDTTKNPTASDDHDLILQVVPFRKNYFVSFARLKNKAMGVRLDENLAAWKTLRLEWNQSTGQPD